MKLRNDGGGHFWHFLRPEVPDRWSCPYTCELPVFFLFLTLYLPLSNRGQHYVFNVNPTLLIMHRLMKETLPISIYVRSYNNLIDNSNICQGKIQRIMAMIDSRVTENCLVDVICKYEQHRFIKVCVYLKILYNFPIKIYIFDKFSVFIVLVVANWFYTHFDKFIIVPLKWMNEYLLFLFQ